MLSDAGKINIFLKSFNMFLGGVPGGFKIHPNRQHLIYPVGCTIVIEDLNASRKNQEFLTGHSDSISCLAVSRSGKYLASGQITYMGFKVKRMLI